MSAKKATMPTTTPATSPPLTAFREKGRVGVGPGVKKEVRTGLVEGGRARRGQGGGEREGVRAPTFLAWPLLLLLVDVLGLRLLTSTYVEGGGGDGGGRRVRGGLG